MGFTLSELTELQLFGVCDAQLEPERRGGAGPSGTKAMMIEGRPLMVPVFHEEGRGAFHLRRLADGSMEVCRDGTAHPVSFVPAAGFQRLSTTDGISYRSIALLHGLDCLASTVIQQCARYADEEKRCRFCALGATLKSGTTIARKTPEQLAEVAEAARRLDGVRHVTLTSGTMPDRDRGTRYVGRCAQAITQRSGLPVQIQFEPPADDCLFDELHSMSVASIGMHVESLDEDVRREMTPGKAEIGLDRYRDAFAKAVSVFGKGRVGTYVILGLGENRTTTLRRLVELVRMGVYPLVVPLHRLPGTKLEHSEGVSADDLAEAYRVTGNALKEEGMTSESAMAGCCRCGACSLLAHVERGLR